MAWWHSCLVVTALLRYCHKLCNMSHAGEGSCCSKTLCFVWNYIASSVFSLLLLFVLYFILRECCVLRNAMITISSWWFSSIRFIRLFGIWCWTHLSHIVCLLHVTIQKDAGNHLPYGACLDDNISTSIAQLQGQSASTSA